MRRTKSREPRERFGLNFSRDRYDRPFISPVLPDGAGLRGYSVGGARDSEKHPGFIVNTGNATGEELPSLLGHCKRTVKEKYGLDIEEWITI